MKKAIVTGATGFIGRFLVRELVKNGVNVIAISRQSSNHDNVLQDMPITNICCDLDNYKSLPELIHDRDIDAVFHIAWQGVSDADTKNADTQIKNITATLDVIEAMHNMQIRTFVGAGSIHEFEGMIEMAEDKTINNMGFMYKTAKVSAHWMSKAKAGFYGIRFFWPIISTYGEEEVSNRLINSTIRKILQGVSPDLSAGNQLYDFVHVSDVARALYMIAEMGIDGTNYTIGSGNAKPLKEYMKTVGEVVNRLEGSDVPLGFGKVTGNVIYLPIKAFDTMTLQRDTGFRIQVPFNEGIERTTKWILGQSK